MGSRAGCAPRRTGTGRLTGKRKGTQNREEGERGGKKRKEKHKAGNQIAAAKQHVPPLPSEEFLGLLCCYSGCCRIWTESDPALMRFVELIHLCSARLDSAALMERAVNECTGRWAGQERGAQPCPPVPTAFPWILALRCLWAGWERQRRWPGRALGLQGPGLCPQVFGGAAGWDSTAEPFGDRCWGFWGCPDPQPGPGERLLCLLHPGKAFRAESVQGQPGWGCLRPPEHTGVFSRTGGCPCHAGILQEKEERAGFRVGLAEL